MPLRHRICIRRPNTLRKAMYPIDTLRIVIYKKNIREYEFL